jgi:hypothetical protein
MIIPDKVYERVINDMEYHLKIQRLVNPLATQKEINQIKLQVCKRYEVNIFDILETAMAKGAKLHAP